MENRNDIMFGVDNSGFSRDALIEVARFLKDDSRVRLLLFHGYSLEHSCLAELQITQDQMNEYKTSLQREKKAMLAQIQRLVEETGFPSQKTAVRLDDDCRDPSESMLKRAEEESCGLVCVGRWGTSTLGHKVIGSTTYRLSCLSDRHPVWIVNPRVRNRNVLLCIVGARPSCSVIDHAIQYLTHLYTSRYTLLHIIPPFPVQNDEFMHELNAVPVQERKELCSRRMDDDLNRAHEMMDYGKKRLIDAGIKQNQIYLNVNHMRKSIAEDIIQEMKSGEHGVLVMGRRGSKYKDSYGLSSNAYKLLYAAPSFLTCIVN
jgi:nucleotide-binding universal stress UspA family protein